MLAKMSILLIWLLYVECMQGLLYLAFQIRRGIKCQLVLTIFKTVQEPHALAYSATLGHRRCMLAHQEFKASLRYTVSWTYFELHETLSQEKNKIKFGVTSSFVCLFVRLFNVSVVYCLGLSCYDLDTECSPKLWVVPRVALLGGAVFL